eukprot:3057067-Rhodomonas_salina.6
MSMQAMALAYTIISRTPKHLTKYHKQLRAHSIHDDTTRHDAPHLAHTHPSTTNKKGAHPILKKGQRNAVPISQSTSFCSRQLPSNGLCTGHTNPGHPDSLSSLYRNARTSCVADTCAPPAPRKPRTQHAAASQAPTHRVRCHSGESTSGFLSRRRPDPPTLILRL